MELGLVFGLLKVAIETFQDERRDRFLKKWTKLEREWNEEMAVSHDDRSDLKLDRLLLECDTLTKLVLAEAQRRG